MAESGTRTEGQLGDYVLSSNAQASLLTRPAPRLSGNVLSVQEAMSIKFNTLVYDVRASGRELCVLSLGEAFFDLPKVDVGRLPHPKIFHYSDSRGIASLRRRISEYYAAEYGLPVDPQRELIVTAGSKAAIYMALLCVLDPQDEVLIPEPAWVSYSEQVKLCQGRPVTIPYTCPIDDWQRYITPRTKVLIINNPHNPTGYRYTNDELAKLTGLASERGIWLFSDEAYSDFTSEGSFLSTGAFDRYKDNVVVFNSMSKNYGISGWRLGYVIAQPMLIDQILKVNQHVITCPSTVLEYFIDEHFDDLLAVTKPQIRRLLEKRAQVALALDRLNLPHLPGDSTFYFFVSIRPTSLGSEVFSTRLLQEKLISVVPGIGYGESCDGFIRISIGTESLECIERALSEIKSFVDATTF